MNSNRFVLLISLILLLSTCKKGKQEKVWDLVTDPNLMSEVAIIESSKILLGSEFKQGKVEKIGSKYEVSIDYGGTSAYTFHQSKEGAETEIRLKTAKVILELFQSLESRRVVSIQLSVIKPLFVMEEQIKREIVEEFEIYRVRLKIEDLNKIPEWRKIETKHWKTESYEKGKLLQSLSEIEKYWTVELNEMKKIDLE